jgi:hypothetical protein
MAAGIADHAGSPAQIAGSYMMRFMQILSITLSTDVYKDAKQFSIQEAATVLGLEPDAEVSITVRKASGELVFHGKHFMKSGYELYGDGFKALVLQERIIAEVSRPPKA